MIYRVVVRSLILLCLVSLSGCRRSVALSPQRAQGVPCILIVIDGLRPDYATSELMPNLTALGAGGVVFENHRSIFPTLTRVNAATIVTGGYPSSHGLLGNLVYYPTISERPLSTGDASILERIDQVTGGQAVTALTLGELIEGEGRDLLVIGSGSSGLSWLLAYGTNPKPGRSQVVNPQLFLPRGLERDLAERIGETPQENSPDTERNRWVADALIELGLGDSRPALSIVWFAEPDLSEHRNGVGSPEALEAVRSVDAEIGRIIQALSDRGWLRKTNLIVTTDHGFIRHTGSAPLVEGLIAEELKDSRFSSDVLVVGDEIYIQGEGSEKEEKIERIATWLAFQPFVGGVFTRGKVSGRPGGAVRGTLSYETIYRECLRAGDIMIARNWRNDPQGEKYGGLAGGKGIAGHGGASPYELQIPMIATGPGFKSAIRSSAPSSHTDLAPTLLHLLGIAVPESMDGRILSESLDGGPDPESLEIVKRTYRAKTPMGGDAQKIVEVSDWGVDGVGYLQWVRALYQGLQGITPGTLQSVSPNRDASADGSVPSGN